MKTNKTDQKIITLLVIAFFGLFITFIIAISSSNIELFLGAGLATILLTILYGFFSINQELKNNSMQRMRDEILEKAANELIPLLGDHFREVSLAEINNLSQKLLADITSQFEQNIALIEASTGVGADNAYKYSASRYGMGYQLLNVKCIIGADGSAIIERVVTVEAFSEIEKLDTYILVPEDDIEQKFGIEDVESLTADRNVQIESPRNIRNRNKVSLLLVIAPRLHHGDEFIYRLAQKTSPRSFAIDLTDEEVAKRETPYDYFAWNINRPTRKLIMTVEFPRNYKPTIYDREVRFASASGSPAEQRQFEEQKNLQRFTFSDHREVASLNLEVDYPMTGLMYLLRWDPRSIRVTF
jgi:hypothetical protein